MRDTPRLRRCPGNHCRSTSPVQAIHHLPVLIKQDLMRDLLRVWQRGYRWTCGTIDALWTDGWMGSLVADSLYYKTLNQEIAGNRTKTFFHTLRPSPQPPLPSPNSPSSPSPR